MKAKKATKAAAATSKKSKRKSFFALMAFVAVVAFFTVVAVFAGSSDVGTSGAQFLKIGMGKAEAMGGAYTAFADDATSLYWNPAGLSHVRDPQIYLSHNQFLEDLRYNFIGYSHPLSREKRSAFGVGLQILTQDSIPKLDNTGTEIGSFSPMDLAVSLGYGRRVSKRVYAGGALKWIRQSIDDFTATAYALDLGAQARFKDVLLGGSIVNLGSKVKFRSQSDPLPMNLRLGLGYSPSERPWRAALETNLPRDNRPDFHLGGEYRIEMEKVKISLRGGFRNTVIDELGTESGFSFGIGFAFSQLGLDIAFAPYGDLGQSYQLGLSYRFEGKPPSPPSGIMKE